MTSQTILITGGTGQVGSSLLELDWPAGVQVVAPTRDELDLFSTDQIAQILANLKPDAVINTAAWTQVDHAEKNIDKAFIANAVAPAALASYCRDHDIPLVHISTDYVFDGNNPTPYTPDFPVRPINVYGASKLSGELAVITSKARSIVLRTSWVYNYTGQNFVRTMLRLAKDRETVSVVNDQIGSPTSASDIAICVQSIVLSALSGSSWDAGVHHFTNAGSCSWAEFASEIFALSKELGGPHAAVQGIPSSEYPTPALRPSYSKLDCSSLETSFGIRPRHWREALAENVNKIRDRGWM